MKNEPPTHVLGLAHPPIPVVRIGFIGLGNRRCDCGAFSSHSDVYHASLDQDGPQLLCGRR